MDGKARLGQWMLLVIIVVMALSELALAGISLQAGQFRGEQIGRVLLTGWLLWQIWDGAGWARWLLAVLFLVAALIGVIFGLTSQIVEGRPDVLALVIGLGAVFAAFAIGLASPWVGAYQAARRGSPGIEPFPLPINRNKNEETRPSR